MHGLKTGLQGNPCFQEQSVAESVAESVAFSANGGAILIADGDGVAREELTSLFEAAGYAVTAVSSGEEALRVAGEAQLSVVLLEIPLGRCRATRCAGQYVSRTPNCRSFSYRARGQSHTTVSRDFSLARTTTSSSRMRRTSFWRASEISYDDHQRPRPPVSPNSRRGSKKSCSCLPTDSVQEIAKRLFISRKNVGTHVENILRKLGVRSQAQAVALAFREELVDVTSNPA